MHGRQKNHFINFDRVFILQKLDYFRIIHTYIFLNFSRKN